MQHLALRIHIGGSNCTCFQLMINLFKIDGENVIVFIDFALNMSHHWTQCNFVLNNLEDITVLTKLSFFNCIQTTSDSRLQGILVICGSLQCEQAWHSSADLFQYCSDVQFFKHTLALISTSKIKTFRHCGIIVHRLKQSNLKKILHEPNLIKVNKTN